MSTTILERQFETLSLTSEETTAMKRVVAVSREFFDLPADEQARLRFHELGYVLGLRVVGDETGEVSGSPADLNISMSFMPAQFSAMIMNGRLTKVLERLPNEQIELSMELFAAYGGLLQYFVQRSETMLTAVAEEYGRNAPFFTSTELLPYSWVQVNYLDPHTAHPRPYMQYPHNDGHLLTFASSDVAGLELSDPAQTMEVYENKRDKDTVDGVPAELGFDKTTVFIGDALTDLVDGNRLGGVPHHVRNYNKKRLSVINFINPNFDRLTVRRFAAKGVLDLAFWRHYQHRFGLPTLHRDPESPATMHDVHCSEACEYHRRAA